MDVRNFEARFVTAIIWSLMGIGLLFDVAIVYSSALSWLEHGKDAA